MLDLLLHYLNNNYIKDLFFPAIGIIIGIAGYILGIVKFFQERKTRKIEQKQLLNGYLN